LSDRPNLSWVDDRAVQLVGRVLEIRVELFVPYLASPLVPHGDLEPGFLGLASPALLRDSGADSIDLIAHIHAVGDRPLIWVLGNQILVEKAQCVLGGCRREADNVRVKVLEDLSPEAVD